MFQFILQCNSTESVSESRWKVIQKAFSKGIKSTQELEQAILTYNPEYAKLWKFEPLHILFERVSILHSVVQLIKQVNSQLSYSISTNPNQSYSSSKRYQISFGWPCNYRILFQVPYRY